MTTRMRSKNEMIQTSVRLLWTHLLALDHFLKGNRAFVSLTFLRFAVCAIALNALLMCFYNQFTHAFRKLTEPETAQKSKKKNRSQLILPQQCAFDSLTSRW